MKKLITSLMLAIGLLAVGSSQAASYSLVTTAGVNGGTNVVFSNAVVITSITVQNVGGTNFNFAMFNSNVRTNTYLIAPYTNYLLSAVTFTNVYTNINIGNATATVSTNFYTALQRTTNSVAATAKTYPILFGPVTIMTNTSAFTFPINQYFSHGLTITNNQQAAGVCAITINYSTPGQ
jgi:hypothetical protein